MATLAGRSFLKEIDFSKEELQEYLDLAKALKFARRKRADPPRLSGRNIALIFEKSSTRTRCAFEVAAHQQGAHVTYLDPSGSQMGHKESIDDTAAVLGRMFDAIEYRGTEQRHVEALAEHSGVPVFNGLTNEWHPTQMLADLMTMQEHTRAPREPLRYAFVGDGRYNMGRSLLVTGAIMGADVRLVVPSALRPPPDVIELARSIAQSSGAKITITDDLGGVEGAEFVHTDVWVSMGEPKEVWSERAELLAPYQVNAALLARAGVPGVKFMHCLPAFHDASTTIGAEIATATGMDGGLEVTDEVFRSRASIVFDQAENRLHTIKAILVAALGQPS